MIPIKSLVRDLNLLTQFVKVRCALPSRGFRFGSKKTEEDVDKNESISSIPADDEELAEMKAEREAEIQRKRNRSNLTKYHRDIQNDIVPDDDEDKEWQKALVNRRKKFGMFGKASGVDPSILWPSTVELSDMKEYEQVAHPYTVQELISREKERQQKEQEEIEQEKQQILENVAKLDSAIFEFRKKISTQLDKEIEAKAKHDKTLKELRKYFGYNISRNDPRVAVYMEKKQLEEKKAKKEAKRKQKVEERRLLMAGELKPEDVKKKAEKPKAAKKDDDEEDEFEKKAAKSK